MSYLLIPLRFFFSQNSQRETCWRAVSILCEFDSKKINFNPILTPAKNEITRKVFFLDLKILWVFLVILNLCLISVLSRMLDVNKNRSAES